ncbi:MAG TPA: sulfite exporter TauE/SafE family protein, partial [Leptospiraceae bacterium]|nr:sulfite exporter TauE/SafE family protein [Leptospiraceae bacterium]
DMIGRGKNAYLGNFLLGLVTGFLPCGALYPAYAVSLAAGNAYLGAAGMSLFFLGTLPGNSVIFLSYNILKRKLSTGQLKMIYLVLGVVGISSLYVKIGDPEKAKTCHTPGIEHHEEHSESKRQIQQSPR